MKIRKSALAALFAGLLALGGVACEGGTEGGGGDTELDGGGLEENGGGLEEDTGGDTGTDTGEGEQEEDSSS